MERDKVVVVLDLLAGMACFHDDDELGEVYGELYQQVALRLLANEQSHPTPAERAIDFLNTFYRLPEPDQQVLRNLLAAVV